MFDDPHFDHIAKRFAEVGTTSRRGAVRLLVGAAIAGVAGVFRPRQQTADAFSRDIHGTATRTALKDKVGASQLDVIIDANRSSDDGQLPWQQHRHFDNVCNRTDVCKRRADGLNKYLNNAVRYAGPRDGTGRLLVHVTAAHQNLGYAFHAIQDFWSHTNAIEMKWVDAPLLLAECDPSAFEGIQSGFFNVGYGLDGCPSSGKPHENSLCKECHTTLNKDEPDSPKGAKKPSWSSSTYHQLAKARATTQSKRLWTAFVSRMRATYDGKDCMDADCLIKKVAYGGTEYCGCPKDRVCTNNECVCPTGTQLCENTCRLDDWFDSNRAHCGSCGEACASGEECVDGRCRSTAPTLTAEIRHDDGVVIKPTTSTVHAGDVVLAFFRFRNSTGKKVVITGFTSTVFDYGTSCRGRWEVNPGQEWGCQGMYTITPQDASAGSLRFRMDVSLEGGAVVKRIVTLKVA